MNKKSILVKSFLALFSLAVVSCTKDVRLIDTATPIEQSPFLSPKDYYLEFLSATGFSQTNPNIGQVPTEMGYEFEATTNGEISSVYVKIPSINPAVRVTIWDADNASPLVTTMVNVTAANNVFETAITPLTIVKNKKYDITMNSKDWYHHKHPDVLNVTYPLVIGPLKYNKVLHAVGSNQTLPKPTAPILNHLNGDVRFKFKITH